MIRIPSGIQEVGEGSHRSALTVTATAQQITLTGNKKSIEIIPNPTSTNEVYYGGSGVTSANGIPLGSGKIWMNCKAGWNIYLVCAAGETEEVRICEYD